MNSVKDLIYFDYDKAKSLNSQLSGGIVSEITRAIEEQGGLQSEFGFDIKLLKAKVGATADEKTIKTERIELYHELQKTAILSHPQRIKVSIARRMKLSHPQRTKVSH